MGDKQRMKWRFFLKKKKFNWHEKVLEQQRVLLNLFTNERFTQ